MKAGRVPHQNAFAPTTDFPRTVCMSVFLCFHITILAWLLKQQQRKRNISLCGCQSGAHQNLVLAGLKPPDGGRTVWGVFFFLFFWFFSFFLVFSALQKVVKWEKRGHVRLAGRLSANNSLQYLPPCVGIRTSSPKRVADLPQRLLTAQDQPSREHELDCPLLQLLHRKLCMFFSSLRMETCQARHCGRREVMLPLSWGAFRVYF